MKKLKTSTQIALKFTIYFMVIFSILWITLNLIFLNQRIESESHKIQKNWWNLIMWIVDIQSNWITNQSSGIVIINKPIEWWRKFKPHIPLPIVSLEYEESIGTELQENTIIKNISKIDNNYLMYQIEDNKISMIDVSRPIEMQYTLLWITILIIIAGTVFTFWISRRFARSSLQNINELVEYTKQLNIHNLTKKIPISWPEDDEIRIIAGSFQKSLDIIKEQTDSLKDFVSYASHELKTPLSTIRGLVDLSTKTKSIEISWPKIKKTLTEMSDLLDTLLLITKREFHDIQKENIDIIPLLHNIWEQIQWQYQEKHIHYTTQMLWQHKIKGNTEIIKIIISNLLNNAYKFTSANWIISLTVENNQIIITDNGIGISKDDQEKIRTRFWKKSTENNSWYGLWLYMVKLLIEKLWRTIQWESIEKKWTTFTITMK
jgi:signal transduction histidine kinase